MKNILFFIYFLYAQSSIVKSLTDDEFRAHFIKYVIRCNKEHQVDMKELFQLQKLIVPKDNAVMCLLACAYKKEGILTEKGMLNYEHALELAELAKNDDEERFTNAKKLAEVCVKVNDVEVTDGDKGCERAMLLFKCGVDHAPKLGFKLM